MPDVHAPAAPPAIDRRELARLLSDELSGTRALLEVLGQESNALAADAEGIARAAARKLELVAQLEQVHNARCELLQRAGVRQDRPSMERLLRLLDEPELTACWRQLREAVQRCRDANLINGAVVELNRQHTRRALDLLRGHTPEATLYGAAGTHQTTGTGRVLAKA